MVPKKILLTFARNPQAAYEQMHATVTIFELAKRSLLETTLFQEQPSAANISQCYPLVISNDGFSPVYGIFV